MIEQVQHQDAEYRDCEQTGDARNGIVNSRCDAYPVSRDGVHNNGSQGRHTHCHTETKHSDCREKLAPVKSRERKSASGNIGFFARASTSKNMIRKKLPPVSAAITTG